MEKQSVEFLNKYASSSVHARWDGCSFLVSSIFERAPETLSSGTVIVSITAVSLEMGRGEGERSCRCCYFHANSAQLLLQ